MKRVYRVPVYVEFIVGDNGIDTPEKGVDELNTLLENMDADFGVFSLLGAQCNGHYEAVDVTDEPDVQALWGDDLKA